MPPSAPIDSDREPGSTSYFVLEEGSLWRCDNPGGGAGTWTQVLLASAMAVYGLSNLTFTRVRAQGGKVHVIGTAGDASPYTAYIFRSSSNGLVWSYSEIAANIVTALPYTVTSVQYSVTVSPPRPGAWTSAAVTKTVQRKGDTGNTYNPWAWAFTSNTPQGNFSMLTDAATLYQGPPTPYANMELVQSRHPGAVIGDCNKLLPIGSSRTAAIAMLDDYFGAENTGWYKFGLTNYGTLNFPLDAARVNLGIQANSPQATTDTGTFWYFWNTPDRDRVLGFDIAPSNPDWLYVGLGEKILKSEDGGYTWADLITTHGADDIRVHPLMADTIAFWDDNGDLYQAIAGVVQDALQTTGLREKVPLRIAYSTNGLSILALKPTSADTYDVDRWTDGAWTNLETGVAGARALRVYAGSLADFVIYLSGANIRYSADAGATFADRKGGWSGYASPVNIHFQV